MMEFVNTVDNKGFGAGWYLEKVTITANATTWEFPCNQWFDKDKGDKLIVRELLPKSPSVAAKPTDKTPHVTQPVKPDTSNTEVKIPDTKVLPQPAPTTNKPTDPTAKSPEPTKKTQEPPVKTTEPVKTSEPPKPVEPVKSTSVSQTKLDTTAVKPPIKSPEPTKPPAKTTEPVKTSEPPKSVEPTMTTEPVKSTSTSQTKLDTTTTVVEPPKAVEPTKPPEPVKSPEPTKTPDVKPAVDTKVQPAVPTPQDISYKIVVKTGNVSMAGTDANVSICLFGEKEDTGDIALKNGDKKNPFEQNQVDTFNITAKNVGDIKKIRIGHGMR